MAAGLLAELLRALAPSSLTTKPRHPEPSPPQVTRRRSPIDDVEQYLTAEDMEIMLRRLGCAEPASMVRQMVAEGLPFGSVQLAGELRSRQDQQKMQTDFLPFPFASASVEESPAHCGMRNGSRKDFHENKHRWLRSGCAGRLPLLTGCGVVEESTQARSDFLGASLISQHANFFQPINSAQSRGLSPAAVSVLSDPLNQLD